MKIKKFAAILLVVILVLALTVPAMAAGSNDYNSNVTYGTTTGGTITIVPSENESLSGKTFIAYKVFDLVDVYKIGSETHYAYDLEPAFKGLFATLPIEGAPVVTSEAASKYVKDLTTAAQLNAFGTKVAAYVSTYTGIDLVVSGTGSVIDNKYVFSGLDKGYYVIKDTTAASDTYNPMAYAVVTNYNDVTIVRKGTTPTVKKSIINEDTDEDGILEFEDPSIGATVPFKLTSEIPNMTGIASYTFLFTDILSSGLTYNADSLVVKINGNVISGSGSGAGYTAAFNGTDNKLTITFVTTNWATAYHVGDSIVATYSATINKNAISNTDIENNKATVTYSNSPTQTTTSVPSIVKVSELNFTITKTNDATESPKALAGAEFELYTDTAHSNAVKFSKGTNSDTYYVNNTTSGSTVLTSDSNGLVKINGLGAGTYYLVETKAPAGYNLLTSAVTINVTATLTALDDDSVADDILYAASGTDIKNNSIKIQNSTGVVLPSTGGIGTTMFKLGGIMIILLAGVFLVINRKKVFGSGK